MNVPLDETTQQWWDETRARRLTVQRCGACGHLQHYPRPVCLSCGGAALSLVPVAGTGVVETFTVVRRTAYADLPAPYVVAVVALTEGPRLLTNVTPLDAVAIGRPVRVDWRPLDDGRNLPVFVLEG
ncbi:OB-fold domain-containing protein [Dactylosporangium sp. NPDC005572]|uniref:Zn-ribbon domain-containing OB-fold protein n=1 Tax=Dactylosporangium sp. NPDC005572 TaxID=3156889 RepID=UPI0033B9F9E5